MGFLIHKHRYPIMNDCSVSHQWTKFTFDYGTLIEARCFVRRRWEPRDEYTWDGLLRLANALGVAPKRPSDQEKVVRCLSDLCMAIRHAPDGIISWQTGSAEMAGPPYGRDIAIPIMERLHYEGLMSLVQKSSKQDKLARIYAVDGSICSETYRFKQHHDYRPVEVRSTKRRLGHKIIGGTPLGRRAFIEQIDVYEEQIYRINDFMAEHPLCSDDGISFSGCRRIFNNGSLKSGGRVYGDWQSLPEDERLKLRIDGEPVCEIDIKACFLALAYGAFGNGVRPSDDPYSDVGFVKNCQDPERRKELRTVAKLLVVAYLSKDGDMKKFPKVEQKRGEKKAVPFRKKFNLTHNVDHYIDDILKTHPVLVHQKQYGDDLMFKESSLMLSAIQNLLSVGVVSFPIHDCLLVSLSNKDAAVQALSDAMRLHLHYQQAMDISYFDESGCKVVNIVHGSGGKTSQSTSYSDWGVTEDYDLIE